MLGFQNLECLIVVMFVYYFLGACENWFVHFFIESYSFFNLLSKIGLFNAMIKVAR